MHSSPLMCSWYALDTYVSMKSTWCLLGSVHVFLCVNSIVPQSTSCFRFFSFKSIFFKTYPCRSVCIRHNNILSSRWICYPHFIDHRSSQQGLGALPVIIAHWILTLTAKAGASTSDKRKPMHREIKELVQHHRVSKQQGRIWIES